MDENAMWSRYSRFFEIALVLLSILMASGDDFHLCRIMVPSAFSTCAADILPLDDPNTDFTKSNNPQSSPQIGKFGFRDMADSHSRLRIAFPLALFPSLFHDSDSSSNHAVRADLLTPLRC